MSGANCALRLEYRQVYREGMGDIGNRSRRVFGREAVRDTVISGGIRVAHGALPQLSQSLAVLAAGTAADSINI